MMLRDRYLGSVLGIIWAIINPLLLLSIYTIIFAFVFKAKLPGADTSIAYVLWLISGLGPWFAISEGLITSSNSLHSNAGILKNLSVNIECLPISAALCGLVPLIVSLVFLFPLSISQGLYPTWHALAIIPAIIGLLYLVIVFGLGLSVLTLIFRDIGVALPNLLILVLFSSPILYPITALPAFIREYAKWNPIYIIAEWVRLPLIEHQIPPITGLIWLYLFSTIVGLFTLTAFRRVKSYLHALV